MSLQELKENAMKLRKLRDDKEELNERLKDINESIKDLEEHTMDSMMSDMDITEVTVDNVHIKRGVVFRGGYTSHTSKEAFQYLFDSHNDGALKQKIMIDLAQYPDLPQQLTAMGINHEINYSIHHMTLSSILKELVADGVLSTSDFDRYSIYAQPQIKVDVKEKRRND